MTNNTTNITSLSQFLVDGQQFLVSNSKKYIVEQLPKSQVKAVLIEAPTVTTFSVLKPLLVNGEIGKSFSEASMFLGGRVAIVSVSQEMRAQIKPYLMEQGLDKYTAGALAGVVGGAFKYGATGQNIYIGAANNALYETCNNIDICANNPYVNIAFTITVEALDFAAQTALNAAGELFPAFCAGAMVGAVISTMVHGLYVPAVTEGVQVIGNASNPSDHSEL